MLKLSKHLNLTLENEIAMSLSHMTVTSGKQKKKHKKLLLTWDYNLSVTLLKKKDAAF